MEDAISVTLKKVKERRPINLRQCFVASDCKSGSSSLFKTAGAVDFGILIRSDCAFVGLRFPAKQVRKE